MLPLVRTGGHQRPHNQRRPKENQDRPSHQPAVVAPGERRQGHKHADRCQLRQQRAHPLRPLAARAQAGPHAAEYASEGLRDAFAGRAPLRPEALDDPYFQGPGPTTMHIDEVERVWSAIAERDDWAPFEQKIAEVRALGRLLNP